uniref:Sigma-like protein n=1 Tax=Chryseobacterium endophyticum TaxID=1854762 RepID=A0AAU6WKJ7_9FLAO
MKKETSPPPDTPDPMEISDKTSAAPMSSDGLPATDTTSAPGNIKSDTTRISR